MRIGILKCLLYYPFQPFYQAFFEKLGMEVVVSPAMTAETFHRERRQFVGDICLPVESAFIHAERIKGDVDVLFLPRMNAIHQDAYVCPVCAGLPYVISSVVTDLPPVLRINLTPYRLPDEDAMKALKALGIESPQVLAAHATACETYEAFVDASTLQASLDAAIATATRHETPAEQPNRTIKEPRHHVLMLGMPYVLGDGFLNYQVQQMFTSRGCRLTTPFMIAPEMANREVVIEGYPIYWTFAGMSVAALDRSLRRNDVDGVVYCSSFACGVDSTVVPLVQSACARSFQIPFCNLVFDEHVEASHVEVRVEAFLDCLASQKRKRQQG